MVPAAYDLGTLERARHDSPLQVDHGLAITRGWVARAPASPHVAGTAINQWGLPGHRTAMRALLADCQRWVEQPAAALGSPLVVDQQAGGGELLWLREPTVGFRVGVAQGCGALMAEGDRLLAVRCYQRAYVLVVCGDTVTTSPTHICSHLWQKNAVLSQLKASDSAKNIGWGSGIVCHLPVQACVGQAVTRFVAYYFAMVEDLVGLRAKRSGRAPLVSQ